MPEIWDSWVPGVLGKDQIKQLAGAGFLTNLNSDAIDPSAVDLRLSDQAYTLARGCVKPFGDEFLNQLLSSNLATPFPNVAGEWKLEPRTTYLFKLEEGLKGLRNSNLWGQATAKSSVGRLDVLARLIVDGMRHYEGFDPSGIPDNTAAMFIEVTPITFPVRVRPGDSLSQLRLFYGTPDACELKSNEIGLTCLGPQGNRNHLTVDLSPVDIFGVKGCGFRAKTGTDGAIPMWEKKSGKPNPAEFWELVCADQHDRLLIEKDRFYILRSKERLRVPPGIAVYARAIDEEIGEMRIHYAGFAHPFFGWSRKDPERGTPLIFEVRGHSVPVSLRDGEVLARLRFFRMSTDPVDDGSGGPVDKAYGEQNLKLSKYFADWSSPPFLADTA